MPVLRRHLQERKTAPAAASTSSAFSVASGLLPQCANPKCSSGWIKLWRSRQVPVLEGKWACSEACMQVLVRIAVTREAVDQITEALIHQHRIPLGLMLLSRGVITQPQLKKALAAQKKEGEGRLGEWLVRQKAASEDDVVRALSSQWNCPVLSPEPHDPALLAGSFPRLMVDSFGAVPLRLAGRQLLYVAFEDRIDRCLVLAVERMLGLRVEPCVMRESEFRLVRQQMLRAQFPKTRLLEAVNVRGVVHAFTSMIEERKAVRSQIVRVGDAFWLRTWIRTAQQDQAILPGIDEVEDMVCSLQSATDVA